MAESPEPSLGSNGQQGDRDPEASGASDPPPLDGLEALLCFSILDMGETGVADSNVFKNLRRCSTAFHPTAQSMRAAEAAGAAAAAGAQAVVVFESLELVKWPIEVPLEELVGVLRLPDLLTAEPHATLQDISIGRAQVHADTTTTDAVVAIANACGTPCGFALVIQRHEFIGILDGEEVLAGLLRSPDIGSPPAPAPQALSQEAAAAVQTALAGRATGAQGLLAVEEAGFATEKQRGNGNNGSAVIEQGDGAGTKAGVPGAWLAADVPLPTSTGSNAAPLLAMPETGDPAQSMSYRKTC